MKRVLLVLVPFVAFLVLGALLFPSAGRDDKYLTFWPAHALVEQGEILSYNGERLEQSSSMLLVLAIALVSAVTQLAVPVAGWVLGILGGLAAIASAGVAAHRCRPGTGPAAMLVTGTAGAFVYWSFAGAEPPWVALAALVFALAAASALEGGLRHTLGVALAALALVLVRPEGALVGGCVAAGLLAVALVRRRRDAQGSRQVAGALRILAIVVVATAAVALGRLAYFDTAIPQPVLAKSGGLRVSAVREGLRYLTLAPALWPVLALGAAGVAAGAAHALRSSAPSWTRIAVGLTAFAYVSFVVLVGGDWMEGSRFLAHAIPIFAVLAVDVLASFPRPAAARAGIVALTVVGSAGAIQLSRVQSRGLPLWVAVETDADAPERYAWIERANWSHRRDIPVAEAMDQIVRRLHESGEANPHLLAENTGFVVYHTVARHYGAVTILDGHGLSDTFITHTALGHGVLRAQFGVMWTPERMMAAMAGLPPESGVPDPDIVFFNARTAERAAWTADAGLAVVYVHESPNELGHPWTSGRWPGSAQVIAVRAELAGRLQGLELPGNDRATWMP